MRRRCRQGWLLERSRGRLQGRGSPPRPNRSRKLGGVLGGCVVEGWKGKANFGGWELECARVAIQIGLHVGGGVGVDDRHCLARAVQVGGGSVGGADLKDGMGWDGMGEVDCVRKIWSVLKVRLLCCMAQAWWTAAIPDPLMPLNEN